MGDQTKTVLGRVFTWDETGPAAWRCQLSYGRELRIYEPRLDGVIEVSFLVNGSVFARHFANVAIWFGDKCETEKMAILALQSLLRKMAELEVET